MGEVALVWLQAMDWGGNFPNNLTSIQSARNPSSALQPSTTSTSVWSVLPAPKESMTRSTQARTALKSVSQLHISFL